MAEFLPNENLKILVQHAIFNLEEEIENALVKLDRLDKMIVSARSFKENAEFNANLWTHQMEEKLVSDIFRAQDLRRKNELWAQDLVRFQKQLDTVLEQLDEQ